MAAGEVSSVTPFAVRGIPLSAALTMPAPVADSCPESHYPGEPAHLVRDTVPLQRTKTILGTT
ncbi:MAG: hypothetical protein ACYDGY_03530, partial [Acidimicrobiales bacterium]